MYTNKKISLGLAVSLMAIAAAITYIISTSYSMSLYNGLIADVQQRAEMYTNLEQIDAYIRSYYNGTIDENKLKEALAEAYASVLDSNKVVYYNADEYPIYKEHINGTHLGIGAYVEESGGCPCVVDVLPNSPAQNAGIAIGESIVAINGEGVLEMGYKKAYSLLTAEAGTQLSLTIRSEGIDRSVSLSTVQMTVAEVSTSVVDGYAYIKVQSFSEKTYRQFVAGYSMLLSSDVKGIIIDLRNNSGYIFDPVFNLLNILLPSGSTPYFLSNASGAEAAADITSGENSPSVPVAVLVNANTSGPAELLAASLRDNLSASVIGNTTSGNAEYLETFDLYDNTAISLPTGILRSGKTSFSTIGVKPDFEILTNQDPSNTQNDSTDAYIKRAIEILSQTAK